jgi:hypothetical protein
VQRDKTGSEMAEEVLLRQAMTVAYGSGHSLETPEKPSPIQKPAASSGTWQASIATRTPRPGRRACFGARRGTAYAPLWLGGSLSLRGRTLPYSPVETTGRARIMAPERGHPVSLSAHPLREWPS